MAFHNPCVRPANSSVVTYSQRSTNSIKSLIHRQLFKKSSAVTPSRPPIHRSVQNHSHTSARFQRIKGSNIVREINPIPECSFKKDSTNNYDMTIFHDDLEIVLSRRQLKKMPSWTRKSQFELAIINQIYFNKNPEDIFGSVQNPEVSFAYSMFPPNFV